MEKQTRQEVVKNRVFPSGNEVSVPLIAAPSVSTFIKQALGSQSTTLREPTCATGKGEGPGGQGSFPVLFYGFWVSSRPKVANPSGSLGAKRGYVIVAIRTTLECLQPSNLKAQGLIYQY